MSTQLILACSLWKILDEIDEHGIKIYHLPDAESDEDEDFKEQTRILKVNTPLIISFKRPSLKCVSVYAVGGTMLKLMWTTTLF